MSGRPFTFHEKDLGSLGISMDITTRGEGDECTIEKYRLQPDH